MTREDPLYRVPVLTLKPGTTHTVVEFYNFRDQRDKTEFMRQLATDPRQSRRAASIAHATYAEQRRDKRATFEALHYWRCKHLPWRLPPEQTLQSPDHAIVQGHGDCTAQSILAGAFATALETPFVFVTFGGTPDDSEHIAPAIYAGRPGTTPLEWYPYLPDKCPRIPGWWWSDTSVPIGRASCVRFDVAPACPVRVRAGVA